MNHKNILNETNFMRRMMGLQAINERIAISPEEQENMQLISNVMTPQGYQKSLEQGGYGTVPFKNSKQWWDLEMRRKYEEMFPSNLP